VALEKTIADTICEGLRQGSSEDTQKTLISLPEILCLGIKKEAALPNTGSSISEGCYEKRDSVRTIPKHVPSHWVYSTKLNFHCIIRLYSLSIRPGGTLKQDSL